MRLIKNFSGYELNSISLPEPTDSYTPLYHQWVVDTILEEGDKLGLQMANLNIMGNNSGTKILGTFDVTVDDSDMGMRVAFKNSYDKSIPFAMALGAVVFVCSNSVISGELNYKRKHTGNAITDSKFYIIEGLKELNEYYQKVKRDALILETISLINSQVYDILGQLFIEHNIINSMQLNIVKNELFNTVNFKPITSNEFTAWDLYNAVTESLKKSHPTTYISDHSNLHNIFKQLFI